MRNKYKLLLNLQTFNDEVAVEETAVPEAGVNDDHAADDQISTSNDKVDSAFAKRLSSAQEKWNAEKEKEIQAIKDQYKDHEAYKKVAEYTQKVNNLPDIMTTKEQIELEELHERAEQENMTPSQLKRIEALELKAARGEELEAQINQQKELAEFEASLKTFAEGKELDGKPVDHKELWKFMHENNVGNPDIAFKAMKADVLESKLATVKEDSVKEYLSTKSGVKTKGEGLTSQSLPEREKGFKGVENRLIAQLRANQDKI